MLEAVRALDELRFAQGTQLGNYAIGKKLGEGAQGIVYQATDVLLQRQVALKVLAPIGHADWDSDQLREARLIATLDHPNIVRVYHVGHNASAFYMACEFVAGGNLKDIIRRNGPFSPKKALALASDAAEALSHAHSIGVVHRDVKPQNFLIDKKGNLKLCDFGLALNHTSHLKPRKVRPAGTPQFMAPEVWSGLPATPRSDIYNLGACIFYMLAGRPPYVRGNLADLEKAHLEGALRMPPSAPPLLERMIRSCMAIHPDDRPTDAWTLRCDILEVLARLTGDRRVSGLRNSKPAQKRLEPNWTRARQLALAQSPFCRQRDQLEEAARLGMPLIVLQGNDPCLRDLLLSRIVPLACRKDVVLNEFSLNTSLCQGFSREYRTDDQLPVDVAASDVELLHLQLERIPKPEEIHLLFRMARHFLDGGPTILVSGSEVWLDTLVLAGSDEKPGMMTEVKTRLLFPEEAISFFENYACHAGGNRIRWTRDALLLACDYAIRDHVPIFQVATNAVALALEHRMRLITTWCVKQAVMPDQSGIPAEWPDAEMLQRLKTLRALADGNLIRT